MAKATEAQLRELMALIYKAATGEAVSRGPRRRRLPEPHPGDDGPSPAFLAELAARRARRGAA